MLTSPCGRSLLTTTARVYGSPPTTVLQRFLRRRRAASAFLQSAALRGSLATPPAALFQRMRSGWLSVTAVEKVYRSVPGSYGSEEILPPTTVMTLVNLCLLLAALLARVSCLTCETCISPGEGCSGLSHPCGANENTCLTIVGMNSLGGGDTVETLKTCIAAADCYAGSISITTNGGIHLQSVSSCCQDDNCNRWELNLPPMNLTSNGLQCPVCFAFGSDHCEGTETLSCTGVDNHCITVSGMLNAGGLPSLFTARGCSTETACSLPLGMGLYSAGVLFKLNQVVCNPALKASRT
ncbi:phospholipase A2 inhibitor and Ly6/PLAUR domain-containing protein-like [Elgaria multicarinata webbii]|uniref:phospholipase A2 inhibitor and Ly6/PLAUR domain-containing protein-like n=1 Tax=Elgaria multicarinata webbii TaxID=159646 RepID=UPI002FCD69FE